MIVSAGFCHLFSFLCFCSFLQCLDLTAEDMALREVDDIDIAVDQLQEKHYKPEEVGLMQSCFGRNYFETFSAFPSFLLFLDKI